jgi:adenylosuccinate lyase
MIDPLLSISPLDGRYREKIKQLENYFSEYALIRYRLLVELEWFVFLCNEVKLPGTRELTAVEIKTLRAISTDFDITDAGRVKTFEKTTNHDVKAVEYFIKEHLAAYPKINAMSEFIHFGCTSEDINNLAYALLIKDFGIKEYLPVLSGLIQELLSIAKKYKAVPMLSHTHGQPASPTTVGKEIINTVARLERQFKQLDDASCVGKFNGAVGNFNAHVVAYPKINWPSVSHRFINYLGLEANNYTTQIEPHDWYAEIFDGVARVNTILIDFCRDMWMYISLGYFKQSVKAGEVGSSTMPHKVNPIDFENAEGNFGLANAIFRHLGEKLPISRMQRDLSDSTVERNIGSGFGYSFLAFKSLMNGLKKVDINKIKLEEDLNNNWEVLTEAIQTVLRKYKVSGAYEKLKALSRGKKLTDKEIRSFVKQLEIPATDKKRLLELTPATYTGVAEKLVENYETKI